MIPAIVLAAGRSTRMGRTKALLPVGAGETFLTRIVNTLNASGLDDVVAVVGHDREAIVASLEGTNSLARVVENPDYDRGQLTSLVTGINVIDRPGVAAALVTLVDVPLVAAATVQAVVARYLQTRAPVVRPVSGARHGHPLLIDRSLFQLLRAADPNVGARAIVRAYASPQGDVIVDDEGAFIDIDTPQEYERFVRGPLA